MKNKSSDPSPVAFSISLYGMLLAAYPSGFRHEYGMHMAQVFRDCCLRSLPPGWPTRDAEPVDINLNRLHKICA